jgi:hypothetical protein
MSDDLWPDDLVTSDVVTSPIMIVREQAQNLEQHTQGLVTASVDPLRPSETTFRYSFNLHIPSISYKFSLFILESDIDGFPVNLLPDVRLLDALRFKPSIAEEIDKAAKLHLEGIDALISPSLIPKPFLDGTIEHIQISSQKQLTRVLANIFSLNKTKSIIRTLMAQAQEN